MHTTPPRRHLVRHPLDDTTERSNVIRPGDRLRLSVRLLLDLYEMPDHESCTVRLVRTERGPDGAHVLVLVADEVHQ